MNKFLQRLFTNWYHPDQTDNKVGGASSLAGTVKLRDQLVELFKRRQIKSIFDAGCNDCNWMNRISEYVEYHGGDISLGMIAEAWRNYPELDIILHDITTDPVPAVDLLFVRDVAIHLNNEDRLKLWKNWYNSNVAWIMITHCQDEFDNQDIEYKDNQFPFSSVNWEIDPWNFPVPIDSVYEYKPGGRCMALWHRDQFKGIL